MIILQVGIQDEILRLHSMGLLEKLLQDKTSKRHILWATDAYKDLGDDFQRNKEISVDLITGVNSGVIKNRARKAFEQQNQRVRQHAEVFTPLWVCKKMNDFADEVWLGKLNRLRTNVLSDGRIQIAQKRHWRLYVNMRVMEITCGEAPYLVSRYEVLTGEYIPIKERVGLLDRKLRVVSENVSNEEEWLLWVIRAFKATYGYEFQGDNLLIARLNLLLTFEEYLKARWDRKPTFEEYTEIASIISWNIWQMDGISKAIPYLAHKVYQPTLEESMGLTDNGLDFIRGHGIMLEIKRYCLIRNWRHKQNIEFRHMTEGKRKMKFDFVIGNPPYQDETVGDQKTFAPPIYHKFIEASYNVGRCVELIHPARFLFNAGSTPAAWNKKMLGDEHLKVLKYEPDSSKVFSGTDIKGGIAVTYRDAGKIFDAIGTFTSFEDLNTILHKVKQRSDFKSFSSVVVTRTAYRLTEQLHKEYPCAKDQLSNGHMFDMSTNIFRRLPQIFSDKLADDEKEYVQILGLDNGNRITKWVRKDFVRGPKNFTKWKIFVPKANGSGALGEVLSTPLIGQPLIGHTESFISIGECDSESEVNAVMKYVKSKFARTMLGILKITQDNPPEKWRFVPLQDFTPASDIDWTKSVAEIDKQLYAKYGLDDKEIEFIETHVKEMA